MINWKTFVGSVARVPNLPGGLICWTRVDEPTSAPATPQDLLCGIRLAKLKKRNPVVPEVMQGPDDLADDAVVDQDLQSHLLEITRKDPPETVLHKSLWNLMANDLRAIITRRNAAGAPRADLFGFEAPDSDELRLYDVLAWIYGFQRPLQPEVINGVLIKDTMVTFEEMCAHLDIDAELFRRVLARPVREHMKSMLRAIACFSKAYADHCERKLMAYADVSAWREQ